jgi:hypothetical protein
MKYSAELIQPNLISASNASEFPSASPSILSGSVDSSNTIINNMHDDGRHFEPGLSHTSDVVISSYIDSTEISSDSESSDDISEKDSDDDNNFQMNLREWVLQFNISHAAFRHLATILNKRLPYVLPKDPRTLLKTDTKKLNVTPVGCGNYWHNGLIKHLVFFLERVNYTNDTISLLVNIDGLPIYKSSNHQFWLILCKIKEIDVSPLIVGIYEGHEKPSD